MTKLGTVRRAPHCQSECPSQKLGSDCNVVGVLAEGRGSYKTRIWDGGSPGEVARLSMRYCRRARTCGPRMIRYRLFSYPDAGPFLTLGCSQVPSCIRKYNSNETTLCSRSSGRKLSSKSVVCFDVAGKPYRIVKDLWLSMKATNLSPYSSVVERATRNGEVGCSIQPMGNMFCALLFGAEGNSPT